jgi:glucose-6-phosphate dehydrogenase assembly protein OpcA
VNQDSVRRFLEGQEVGVDVAEIEAELNRIWRHAAEPEEEDEDSPPVLKATTVTLVAATRGPLARTTRNAIDAVVDAHPARLIEVEFGGTDDPRRLTAGVSAQCRITGPGCQVCSEEVKIEAGAETLRRLPPLLRPLIVSDLPAVLWWDAELAPEDRLLDDLLPLFDFVVVDSARLADPVASIGRLRAIDALDLGWLRLLPMRRAFADLLDRVSFEPGAGSQGSVLAEFDAGPREEAARASAHLLAGWLGSRLQVPRDRVEIRRRPRADDREPIARSATLRLPGIEGGITAAVERLGSAPLLRAEVATDHVCVLPRSVRMPRMSEGELLGAALDRCGQDPVLARTLEYLG